MSNHSTIFGLAHWMRYALEHDGNLQAPYAELIQRVEKNPNDASALLDMSTIMLMSKQEQVGLELQESALSLQTLYTLSGKQQPAQLRILVFMFPGELMQNTPIDCLLENTAIDFHFLYIAPHLQLPEELPEHDLAFVAIGQSSQSLQTLELLDPILREWVQPVVNFPERISHLTREKTYEQLHQIAGVITPFSLPISRETLEKYLSEQEGQTLLTQYPALQLPLIIRPRDSHAGRHLAAIHQLQQLKNYLHSVIQQDFYISPFIDYSDSEGTYTKYRIVFIEKVPYVCHVAMNSHWVIHYANAGMDASEEKRALEANLMQNFDVFAKKHQAALQKIAETLDLDYVGIDCAENAAGELVVFEADTSIIVHNFDDPEKYGYKQPIMAKVFDAFLAMLLKKANSNVSN